MTDYFMQELTEATQAEITNILHIVKDPSGTPADYYITISDLLNSSGITSEIESILNADGFLSELLIDGVSQGTYPKINLITGPNVTISGSPNSSGSRVDVTISSTGGGFPCDLVMSLSSGSPIPTTDITGATSVYIHTFGGNEIALRDTSTSGSPYTVLTHSGSSIPIPATTNTMYDVFAYISSGSVAFTSGSTTRTTDLPFDEYGIRTKSGDVSRRYIGSFMTSASSGSCNDNLTSCLIWNRYNRVRRPMYITSSTSHTYTTSSYRAWNNDTGVRVGFLVGERSSVIGTITGASLTTSGPYDLIAIGLDSTVAAETYFGIFGCTTTSLSYGGATGEKSLNAGYHYLQAIELGSTGATFSEVYLKATIER